MLLLAISKQHRLTKNLPRSEQYSHYKVKLVGPVAGTVDRERSQRAKFSRKQQVGTRPIDEIDELAAVAIQVRIEIPGGLGKAAHVGRGHIVLPGCGVELQLRQRFESQLGPPAGRRQSSNNRCRISEGTVEDHATSNACAQASNGASRIELSTQSEVLSQRNDPVGVRRPTVDITIESPILAAVVTSGSQSQIPAKNAVAPGKTRRIRRLAAAFSRSRKAQKFIRRSFTGKGIQNPSRERDRRVLRRSPAMLNAHLRCPAVEIAGIGKCWNCQRRERSWIEWRKKDAIHARHNRSVRPVQIYAAGPQVQVS